MNKEEIRQFKSLLKQGSLRHMNIILDDKFQKSLLEIIKDYEEKDKQIQELTNNWNELRQHIKEYLKEWENSDDEWVKGKCDMASDILYDMEEIKGDKE